MKEPQLKIIVSPETYHEVADALKEKGYNLLENVGTLTLEKGTIVRPNVDFRLASIRKDAGLIAARAFKDGNFVSFMEEIYSYIINGKAKEWK